MVDREGRQAPRFPADIYLMQDEESFLPRSVGYGPDGQAWLALYTRARQSGLVTIHTPACANDTSRPFRSPTQGTTGHRVDLDEHMVRTALGKGIQCPALNAHLIGAVERPELLPY